MAEARSAERDGMCTKFSRSDEETRAVSHSASTGSIADSAPAEAVRAYVVRAL
jgi:hypothetical protein